VRFEPHNDQDVANSPRAYRITDHLGSAVAVHRVGSVNPWLHRQFAAFGATVNANAGGGALAGFAVWTDRGFTGHESVQSAGIVHMKGRIYDPELGRFLQADPFVQAPDNSQSLNRYSYVLNNPLSYTDPSGFFFKSLLSSVFQTVFTIAGCSVPGANVVTCFTTATMVSGMTGAANDQPFLNAVRDGAISGVTAVAFMQVGAAVRAGHISPEAGVVLHGAVGAGAAAARGGDPLAGFAAAVLTKSFTLGAEGFLDQINNDAIEALIAGAVGGTISEVTGGKFANGAVTAAMGYAFGEVARSSQRADSGETSGNDLSPEVRQQIFDEAVADLRQRGLIGDHEFAFVNKFATARLDSAGNIIPGSVVAYESSAAAFRAAALSVDTRATSGVTTVGSDSSTIYANATLRRAFVETAPGALYPANYSPPENARFVLLHEFQHGPPRIVSEFRANQRAVTIMRGLRK